MKVIDKKYQGRKLYSPKLKAYVLVPECPDKCKALGLDFVLKTKRKKGDCDSKKSSESSSGNPSGENNT